MTKKKQSTEAAVREIRRRTRRKFAPEEKVRIVLEGLRGEQSTFTGAGRGVGSSGGGDEGEGAGSAGEGGWIRGS
jgi:hypothetical protein